MSQDLKSDACEPLPSDMYSATIVVLTKDIEKLHKSIENSPSHPMEAIFVTGMKELASSTTQNSSSKDISIIEKRTTFR